VAQGAHDARVSHPEEAAAMNTWEDVAAQEEWLNKVALGLMRQFVVINQTDDPLLRVERWASELPRSPRTAGRRQRRRSGGTGRGRERRQPVFVVQRFYGSSTRLPKTLVF
jgi:hypothetical protein